MSPGALARAPSRRLAALAWIGLGALALGGMSTARAGDDSRPAQVAARGAAVMPFDLAATTHTFTKTAQGGRQRVVVKDIADRAQGELIRAHLRDLQSRFSAGDFSSPARIHGNGMPGVAQLRTAQPGSISIAYRDVPGGAELEFRSADPTLISAVHAWFDAQLADHGSDAMRGDEHHHSD
jgi:hypothetical protein